MGFKRPDSGIFYSRTEWAREVAADAGLTDDEAIGEIERQVEAAADASGIRLAAAAEVWEQAWNTYLRSER